MGMFSDIGSNFRKNTRPEELGRTAKKALYAGVGGMVYWAVPTIINAIKKDSEISGMAGGLIGTASAIAVGFAFDKPEIAVGGVTAAGLHLTYLHLNGPIAGALGVPIFAGDPSAVVVVDETANGVSDGNEYFTPAPLSPPAINDMYSLPSNLMPSGTATTMGDLTTEAIGYPAPNMKNLTPEGIGLQDEAENLDKIFKTNANQILKYGNNSFLDAVYFGTNGLPAY